MSKTISDQDLVDSAICYIGPKESDLVSQRMLVMHFTFGLFLIYVDYKLLLVSHRVSKIKNDTFYRITSVVFLCGIWFC